MQKTALAALAAAMAIAPATADARSLPLGDGHVSSSPKKGYVYSCQQRFNPNAPSAQASGDWLDENARTWDPDRKPVVDGHVSWPGEITISVEGNSRVVRGNGLPKGHTTGNYPVSRSDDAYQYDRNPNRITEKDIVLTLDRMPQRASGASCVPMGMIGFGISGVAIFNALDAKGDDAPAHEIQDSCNGHPEHDGRYHYHNQSACLNDTRSGPDGTSDLLGYALDGFGFYGPYENGRKLTSADLDECHGRTSTVMWDGKAVEMYHYVFTDDYPYTIGCFRGTLSDSARQLTSGGNRANASSHASKLQNASALRRPADKPRRLTLFGQRPGQPPRQRPPQN